MKHTAHTYSAIRHLIDDIEELGGACHPDFDAGLEELERQFAEYRLTLATE
jgi:hypothetical protein